MGSGKNLNPADKLRKQQRAAEMKKNKERRAQLRTTILSKKSKETLESELLDIIDAENEGRADGKALQKKKMILQLLADIKKEEAAIPEKPKSLEEMYPDAEGSAYYHPVENPYGVPPPGCLQMWLPGYVPKAQRHLLPLHHPLHPDYKPPTSLPVDHTPPISGNLPLKPQTNTVDDTMDEAEIYSSVDDELSEDLDSIPPPPPEEPDSDGENPPPPPPTTESDIDSSEESEEEESMVVDQPVQHHQRPAHHGGMSRPPYPPPHEQFYPPPPFGFPPGPPPPHLYPNPGMMAPPGAPFPLFIPPHAVPPAGYPPGPFVPPGFVMPPYLQAPYGGQAPPPRHGTGGPRRNEGGARGPRDKRQPTGVPDPLDMGPLKPQNEAAVTVSATQSVPTNVAVEADAAPIIAQPATGPKLIPSSLRVKRTAAPTGSRPIAPKSSAVNPSARPAPTDPNYESFMADMKKLGAIQ